MKPLLRPPNFADLLPLLARARIEFMLIGGGAAIAHGLARTTYDVDVVYARNPQNVERLVAALAPLNPYLRGAPPGLPFQWDVPTVLAGMNFTLTTALGELDLFGEVPGGATYEDLLPYSLEVEAYNIRCRIVGLEKLIALKRAAGRPKDLETISELEALLEERRR